MERGRPEYVASTHAALALSVALAWAGCSTDAPPSGQGSSHSPGSEKSPGGAASSAGDSVNSPADASPIDDGSTDTSSTDGAPNQDDGGDGSGADDTGSSVPPSSWSVEKNVLVLNFDPVIDSSGERAHKHFGWSDPQWLASKYIRDLYRSSGEAILYKVEKWRDLDVYPPKTDGFQYTDSSWKSCIEDSSNCHEPDQLDYQRLVEQYELCRKVKSGTYDEVWLFGGPYFGYWESTMAGDDAFFLNSDPVPGVSCDDDFVIMGFNYERGVAEMLHNVGHRVEFTMKHVFRDWAESSPTPFAAFSRREESHPGRARCGNTHVPPNAEEDYDYDNDRTVSSSCPNYATYPDLEGNARILDCSAWDCTQRGYMKWWLQYLPRRSGTSNGYQNNWWKYLVGFNAFIFEDTENEPDPDPKHCGGYTSRTSCDTHPDRCAWFICGNVCLKEGTEVDPVCDCTQHGTIDECNANSGSCSWYACVDRCLPNGTDLEVVCGSN